MANSLSNLFGKLLKRDSAPEVEPQRVDGRPEHRQDPRTLANTSARVEWFDESGVCRSATVTILETSARGLAFAGEDEFPVDQTVWVETEADQISKTVVRHCEPASGGFLTGAYRVDRERRRADRFPVSGEAQIHWGDAHVGPCDASVSVRNANEFGLQLESSVPLPIGTIVRLQGDSLQCDGSTCYCHEHGDKFIIGLHMVRQAYQRNSLDFKGD